ncbi:MAG: YbhN family protein [Candidatus Nanosalina sp.]
MDSRLHKLLWFGVSTAMIAGMIYFADVGKFFQALRTAKLVYLAPAFVAGMSGFLVWTYVWYSFFRRMQLHIKYTKVLRMFLAGHFLNSITPLGQFGGEPFMAYIISRNTEASYEKAFSTVFSADIVNAVPAFTFILGGAAYLLFLGSVNQIVLQTVYLALLATVVGGTLVYLLWFRAGKIESGLLRMLQKISDTVGRGQSVVERAEESLDRVQESFAMVGEQPGHLMKVAAVAHSSFIVQIISLYFILLSVGVTSDFTPLYFVVTLAALANFAPTPGGSGAFEGAMAGLLTFFIQIDFASALVVAILFRMTTYWPGLLLGYISFNTLEHGENFR